MDYFKDLGGDRAGMEAKLAKAPANLADEARVHWLSQLPRTEARQELMALLAPDSQALAGEAKTEALHALINQFTTERKFDDATHWVSGLGAGDAKREAFSQIAWAWSEKDSLAASQWVNSLPAGQDRDGAALSLIAKIQKSDPEAALVWSNSLSNDLFRKNSTRGIFSGWFSRNPMEALQAFQNLTPEDQLRIFRPTASKAPGN